MNNNCTTTPDSHTANQAVNIETLKTPVGKRESKATQAKQKTSSTIPDFKSVALTDISLGGYRYKSKPLEVYKFACRGNLSVNNTPPKKKRQKRIAPSLAGTPQKKSELPVCQLVLQNNERPSFIIPLQHECERAISNTGCGAVLKNVEYQKFFREFFFDEFTNGC